jgi:hypothetical protein
VGSTRHIPWGVGGFFFYDGGLADQETAMRSEVVVKFGDGQEARVALEAGGPMSHDEARQWLDAEFVAHECEPLRASGKVLIVDKLLSIAQAVGPAQFQQAGWAQAYARAALGATGRERVTVDVAALQVN